MELDLKTKLEQLYNRVESLKEQINTEEATKNAFIMPFLQILGYDIFNPTEVVPEYIADIGTKKGEKVDYVIKKDGEPIVIIECKHWRENADAHNSQLHRYFHVTNARFGVMTNGIIYNFFTDLEKPNIMDDKAFLSIDLSNLKENSVKELSKFAKATFSVDNILESAEALKYIRALRYEFDKEVKEPTDEFVRMLVKRVFDKPLNANRLELFKEYFKKAVSSYMNETINSRLKTALNMNEAKQTEEENKEEIQEEVDENKVVTTVEELEGYQIVKAILREKITSDRIAYRDTQSYFGILLDDNNRKPICRLFLNGGKKYIELFDKGKDSSEKVLIECLDEIYNHKERLLNTIDIY
ncbi:type I restriction endonuclease [Capnocytophaga canis]|uniref:type I restriction endonuclease n=1 Tax=Capnocytophaga canis TaxID=1848903 RepID=UPI00370D86D8